MNAGLDEKEGTPRKEGQGQNDREGHGRTAEREAGNEQRKMGRIGMRRDWRGKRRIPLDFRTWTRLCMDGWKDEMQPP